MTRHINQKHQKFLSDEIQEAFAQEQKRRVREAMCLLYVALTRAAHALHVIVSCGVKPDGNTSGSVILAAMTEDAEREKGVIYELGDAHWFDKLAKAANVDAVEEDDLTKFYSSSRVDRRENAVQIGLDSRRGISNVAPSALESGDLVDLRDVLSTGEDIMAMAHGTLLHACFEKVQWLDQAVPTEAELLSHLEKTPASTLSKRKAIKEFFNAIEKGAFAPLLNFQRYREQYLVQLSDAGNRIEVFTERRFAATIPGVETTTMIEGVVDRLVLVYENEALVAADVIDFKSDAIGQHELAAKVATYSPQLSAYRKAISISLKIPLTSISTRLAFISTGDVIHVDMIEATIDRTTDLKPVSTKTPPQPVEPNSERIPKRIVNQKSYPDNQDQANKRVVNQITVEGTAPTDTKKKQKRKSPSKRKAPKVSPGQRNLFDD